MRGLPGTVQTKTGMILGHQTLAHDVLLTIKPFAALL